MFSGDIPTDPSSLYHDRRDAGSNIAHGAGREFDTPASPPVADIATGGTSGGLISTSIYDGASYNTAPMYYDDGSIGTLYIKKLDKTIKVYEGESSKT